jgi:hypothetical protein
LANSTVANPVAPYTSHCTPKSVSENKKTGRNEENAKLRR